jgi:manganese transport protein
MPPPPTHSVTSGADGFLNSSAPDLTSGHLHWFRRLLGFMGPGYLVAIGYIDPGNWATDLAAGSGFGYSLLWIIMLSNLMAILLQSLAVRLGVVTGMDLAQACRAYSSKGSSIFQWILCEIAICACDLAEVIGTAIALDLLFGIPLLIGITLTILDTVLILALQRRGYRYLEAIIIALLGTVSVCFVFTVIMSQPAWQEVANGFIPNTRTFTNPTMLYIAIGIIGATVMPHNLYLHSSLVKSRPHNGTHAGKRIAIKFATIDVMIALAIAFLINAAILVISSAVFHQQGYQNITEIQDAHRLLTPLLGTSLASFLFAVALLASGQSSTVTATLAGQIVMEGYLNIKLSGWLRRLITRSIAIIPALVVTAIYGESGIAKLLVLSQVILSLQLPFAIIPLLKFTSDKHKMGGFVNPRWMITLGSVITMLIISLNISMLYNYVYTT